MGKPQNSSGIGVGLCSQQKTCDISEMKQDRTKVTTDNKQDVAYALSRGTKISDLGLTLNGHYAVHCTNHASFGYYKENFNEDTHVIGVENIAQGLWFLAI